MKLLLVSVCLLGKSMAEPPAADQYGPPTTGHGETSDHGRPQYGPPATGHGETSDHGRPQYGPPRSRLQPRPSSQYGAPSSGYSRGEEEQPASYEFRYDVSEQETGLKFGHEEQREGDVAQGKYYVLLPDGRTQTVEYVADQDGFRPKISYEGGEGYGSGGSGSQAGYSSGGPGGYSSGGSAGQGGYSSGGPGSPDSGGSAGQGGYSSGGPGSPDSGLSRGTTAAPAYNK